MGKQSHAPGPYGSSKANITLSAEPFVHCGTENRTNLSDETCKPEAKGPAVDLPPIFRGHASAQPLKLQAGQSKAAEGHEGWRGMGDCPGMADV